MDAVEWCNNDSLRGDYLWTSGNVTEAIPDVMTPCAWSAIQRSMADALGPRLVAGHPYCGTIGGRFYLNLSTALSVARRFHTTSVFRELTDRGVGTVPDDVEVPLVDLPFWRSLRDVGLREVAVNVGSIARRRSTRRTMENLPRRCAETLDQIAEAKTPSDLTGLWHMQVEALFAACCALMRYARPAALRQAICHRLLRHSIGEDLANAVTTSSHGDHLASLDLLVGLEQLADGVIDRQTFAVNFGHRGPHEYELSRPRPGEDPAWVDQQMARLASSGQSTRRLLAKRAEQQDQAWNQVAAQGRFVLLRARLVAGAWAGAARRRETLRSASVRGLWVLRAFVRRAGEITNSGDNLWFLSLDETLSLLDGDRRGLQCVDERRALFQRYTNLPRYPTFVRGAFDPEGWAETQVANDRERHGPSQPDGALSGWPGAHGVIEGYARVLIDLDDADSLQPGEILVTPLTNVGWTPVLLYAAAVVTDLGAPLSHAAIVARELGIPAVVGCGNATTRIRTGDKIRVDGARGIVDWA
jgi:pyruvate,water dikinase